MNSENLLSYLNKEEPLDEKAISQIMLLIEKHPYFQLGHMLLLKAMQNTHSEKYNKQLRISGSFISDKRKLFEYINSETLPLASKPEKRKEKTAIKEPLKEAHKLPVEEKSSIEIPEIKDKEKNIEISKPNFPEKIIQEVEKVQEVPAKEEQKTVVEDNNIQKEQTKISEKQPVKDKIEAEVLKSEETVKEPIKKKAPVRKKVDLPEEEIERIANENSKIKHQEIIKDFFHGPKPSEKKTISPEKKSITFPPVKEEFEEIPLGKKVSEDLKKSEKIEELNTNHELKETTSVSESNERIERLKKIEALKAAKESIKNIEHRVEKVEPIKKIERVERKPEIEKREIKPKIEQVQIKKEVTVNKIEDSEKENVSTTDTMSNIFSKIRQIKKEMNITSESTPQTIDVNSDSEKTKLLRSKRSEEKRGSGSGRVIKESFIGFPEEKTTEKVETEKQNIEIEDKTEERNKLKESITAKDLFKQHLIKKEKSNYDETDLIKENDDFSNKSPISKLVDVVNDETTIKNEPEKTEKKEEPVSKNNISEKEPIKTEPISKPIEGESAADALLRRIAEKKKKIKEEQALEEQKKKEAQQKEIEAVNEIIRNTNKQEIIPETKKEDDEEPQKKEETKVSEITNDELKNTTTPEQEKKSNNLIDSFIEKAESLEKIGSKESTLSGDISESSTKETDEIMTETYADILIQQKNYQKAIDVYNKLILKFPEKKTYFAIQIKKVESLIK